MAITATAGGHRSAGRPTEKVLSRKLITLGALDLIKAGGYEKFTMSELARALNVAPSALYNHVSSKQDVLVLIQDHIMTKVAIDSFETDPWDEAVRQWAWSYRTVFSSHTPLIPVIAVLPVTGAEHTMQMYEAVTSGFMKDGWPTPLIVPAIVALESFIFGSAFDAIAPKDIFESGQLADVNPNFADAVRVQHQSEGSSSADTAFELGLEGMISGLQAQRRSWKETAAG